MQILGKGVARERPGEMVKQTHLEHINTSLVQLGYNARDILPGPLRESRFVVRKSTHARPYFFTRSSEDSTQADNHVNDLDTYATHKADCSEEIGVFQEKRNKRIPEYFEYLINLRVARKEGISLHDHLCKDATDGPHINSRGVMAGSQKHFRGAVPQRHNLDGKRNSVNMLTRLESSNARARPPYK
jgi:hypothetical protein